MGGGLLTGTAYGLTQLLSARAAYIHVGAIIGTIMAANVLFVIIPNQRVMVNAMLAGKQPDTSKGAAGALRSLHNNAYLTLPVLFIMVSNHFPFTYGSSWSWAVLIAISILGASARHWFNLHERGSHNRWILPAVALALFSLALALKPADRATLNTGTASAEVTWADVEPIFERHCITCHATNPTHPDWSTPPLGMVMDTPERAAAKADSIYERSVVLKTMPLGNVTKMTDDERE